MKDDTGVEKLTANKRGVEDERARLERLAREGVIRRGTGVIPEGFWDLPRGKPKEGCSVLEALLEERREGR